MKILGLSAFYHDSAAALIVDGEIIAAAQEERFSRKKHDAGYPKQAINFCLTKYGYDLTDIDHIVFYDKPFLKFERLLETYIAFAPRGITSFLQALPVWLKEKLFQREMLIKLLKENEPSVDFHQKLLFSEHHLSHAASAFYPSPFEKALILTMDGVGEWATTSVAVGDGNKISILKELHFPHSLGLLYSAFTYYLGFKVNSGEYKVMGLAPYGAPKYINLILENLIDVKADGSFRLNMKYFDYCTGLTMTNNKFHQLFGGPPRKSDSQLTQREMDIAASLQSVTEIIITKLTDALALETGIKNLCLAGGVALNCVANGKVLRNGKFENIWIQPAAGDAGGALGAALAAHYIHLNQSRKTSNLNDSMKGSYLGPEFSNEEIAQRLTKIGAHFKVLSDPELIDVSASALADGKALGWFQGPMEFGPRALGARSILADARSKTMQSVLNMKVKFRESFRPFAPSVLREDVSEWFDINTDSPYMLFTADVLEKHRYPISDESQKLFGIEKLNTVRSSIPAVTHVDYSARIQTVHRESNPKYYQLISQFKKITGCPVIVNTSFNIRGEPIVCTPEDAFRSFMGTGIDTLAIGNCLLEKSEQNPALLKNYKNEFELD